MIRKMLPVIVSVLAVLLPYSRTEPFSVAEKARDKRLEIISYLREMRPMVFNFPCEPYPKCNADANNDGQKLEPKERVKIYDEIKRVYQEGLVYFYEGNYVNAYNRFLDSQRRTEDLLEGLSQSYIDRSAAMIRDSIEQRDPASEEDEAIVDISIEYGPNSKLRRDFSQDRESPKETRRYNPRNFHYATNKYHIEANMERGYKFLGEARDARAEAVLVDAALPKHRTITPDHRKKRIELYLATIRLARQSKENAYYIFQLKYPYDNYALQNPTGKTEKRGEKAGQVPALDGKQMNWTTNPYLRLKDLHPIFDLRIPTDYRRDAVDARGMVYTEEVDMNVKFKYHKEKPADLKDAQ